MPDTVAPGASLVEVYSGEKFFEGPTWDPASEHFYFTAFAKDNQQVLRLDEPGKATVWLDKTEGINGTFLGQDGRLLGAQAYGHRVVGCKIGRDGPGELKTLAADTTWNQPNDVCQTPRGDIYFTDPDFKQRKTSAVYRLDPAGKVTKIITDMPLPNGVLASNDGKTLYVSDSHLKLWRCYPIRPDGTVGPGRVFFDPETKDRADPDGMTIDEHGNLYLTGRGGIWAVRPTGEALGFIPVPVFCSNLTFGGPDGKTLYITCKGKVYTLAMRARGGQAKGRGREGSEREPGGNEIKAHGSGA